MENAGFQTLRADRAFDTQAASAAFGRRAFIPCATFSVRSGRLRSDPRAIASASSAGLLIGRWTSPRSKTAELFGNRVVRGCNTRQRPSGARESNDGRLPFSQERPGGGFGSWTDFAKSKARFRTRLSSFEMASTRFRWQGSLGQLPRVKYTCSAKLGSPLRMQLIKESTARRTLSGQFCQTRGGQRPSFGFQRFAREERRFAETQR